MEKPISPNEVHLVIPDIVIRVVNNLINKCWNGKSSTIYTDEIIKAIIKENEETCDYEGLKPSYILDNHWLNFKYLYESVGWNILHKYDIYNGVYYIFIKKNDVNYKENK